MSVSATDSPDGEEITGEYEGLVLTLEEDEEKDEVLMPGPRVWGQVRGADPQGRLRRRRGTAWG